MSIKYGTVLLNSWYMVWYMRADKGAHCTYYLNTLATALGFKITPKTIDLGNYGTIDPSVAMVFPGDAFLIEIVTGGYAGIPSQAGNALIKNTSSVAILTSDIVAKKIDETKGLYYQTPLYARYAINDNGDWVLSIAVSSEYNKNVKSVMSANYIGTKINNESVIIDFNGTVWANDKTYNVKYYRLTDINPVYYNSKQTNQIALTDFLVRDNNYNIYNAENIKTAITHRGSLNPYLIKDDKGDEYCVIPGMSIGDGALVLRDTKE